jgi:hypothetical protein
VTFVPIARVPGVGEPGGHAIVRAIEREGSARQSTAHFAPHTPPR